MASHIGRRKFLATLGGAAAAWPLAARAQQRREKVGRIGMLMPYAANDPQVQIRNAAFLQGLQQLGWTVGQNVQIDYRWSGGNMDDTRRYAAELVALAPDLIFAPGSSAVGPLQQATRSVPIVFVLVVDPVGSGFVNSLARSGGNATGFTSYDYGISAKWLELLKEIAPSVTRAAVIRDPAVASGLGHWAAIQSVSPSAAIEVSPVNLNNAGEIERAVAAFARSPNGGLIVTGSALTVLHRDLIIRGDKPADLPVQAPTQYELVVNLKTARALGLEIPPTLLARADEVIE
jgi:putative ABC transport system substrate-binding protein